MYNFKAFRIRKKNNKFFRPVIIKFGNIFDKEEFYDRYIKKSGLNSTEIGFSVSNKIYINEYLSSIMYKDFLNAIDFRKKDIFHKVYSKCNCFFIQQFKDGKIMKFSSPSEYNEFKNHFLIKTNEEKTPNNPDQIKIYGDQDETININGSNKNILESSTYLNIENNSEVQLHTIPTEHNNISKKSLCNTLNSNSILQKAEIKKSSRIPSSKSENLNIAAFSTTPLNNSFNLNKNRNNSKISSSNINKSRKSSLSYPSCKQ